MTVSAPVRLIPSPPDLFMNFSRMSNTLVICVKINTRCPFGIRSSSKLDSFCSLPQSYCKSDLSGNVTDNLICAWWNGLSSCCCRISACTWSGISKSIVFWVTTLGVTKAYFSTVSVSDWALVETDCTILSSSSWLKFSLLNRSNFTKSNRFDELSNLGSTGFKSASSCWICSLNNLEAETSLKLSALNEFQLESRVGVRFKKPRSTDGFCDLLRWPRTTKSLSSKLEATFFSIAKLVKIGLTSNKSGWLQTFLNCIKQLMILKKFPLASVSLVCALLMKSSYNSLCLLERRQ
ncbi:hypothetical protein OGAPHI_000046 [Ogataea philodendri]|uniref:Uncharacterized protein n=1 Tax=Ogataea philodendri TaxID=1378263 RepID=A0A9P8PHZ2_9ASCO|nr:uncharacterized protein OGAPHI_000046 [Ogataea philodendri]KAH3671860.1 hypothetical protein OGAPHI_000046 [Ogataea philodendri]